LIWLLNLQKTNSKGPIMPYNVFGGTSILTEL